MLDVAPARILSVWQLTRFIRARLEEEVGRVWVEGEISNYRKQGSGHQYFTLKDDRSQLPCVLFRKAGMPPPETTPADGMQVQVYGELTVYEARGQYQLVVELIQPRGVGLLQARFEALKRKLQAEGLFDPALKKALPGFPQTIGIVTSPTGAALQDMLNILARRAPWMRVIIHPVRVQGQGASVEIANAIREFNQWSSPAAGQRARASRGVDLIVVTRGGGSIEDLFEFNEEIVARAIVQSALPVVSAVGHEIDFTIADFVADLRAPTPSAAAELVAPDTAVLRRQLGEATLYLNRKLLERVERVRERLAFLGASALEREPRRRLLDARQQLDLAQDSLTRAAAQAMRGMRVRLDEKAALMRASGLERSLEHRAHLLRAWTGKLATALDANRNRLRSRLREAENLLRVLGPRATLERGYSITLDERGAIVRRVSDVAAGAALASHVQDGVILSTVESTTPGADRPG